MKTIVSKKIVSSLIINGILIATVIVMIIPMVIMLAYSFFQYPESFISPLQFFQETPSFQNYADIFITDTFGRYFVNSLMIAIIVTIGNVFFASLCGYAFARYDFPWKHILFASVMGLMMVPQQVIMIPLYRMMVAFDWIDTFWALIIPGILAPFAVFLMRQFIQSLPSDIEDAARIDGAGELYIFFRIVLPLCKPVITVLAIYTFLGSWNSFLYPFLFTNSPEMRTLPVGLAYYIGRQSIDWGHLMAGASISAVPVLLLFILFSKKIIEGLTAGALKE